jgi:hypothetical protein
MACPESIPNVSAFTAESARVQRKNLRTRPMISCYLDSCKSMFHPEQ